MANPTVRNLIKLIESANQGISEAGAFDAETPRDADGRLVHPDVSYDVTDKKVTANMASYSSQVMTKLSQKVAEAKQLAAQLAQLEEEIKAEARGHIADVFGPADELRTRVIETVSFEAKLAVAAKNVPTTKYEKVVAEVEKVLIEKKLPELLKMLTDAKAKYTTYSDKAGALSVKAKESVDLSEGVMDKLVGFFAKFKQAVMKWGQSYDAELRKLNIMLGGNDVNPVTGA